MVEPDGTVLCSDFSDAMVEVVRERAARGWERPTSRRSF
jgi:hypothetical protein